MGLKKGCTLDCAHRVLQLDSDLGGLVLFQSRNENVAEIPYESFSGAKQQDNFNQACRLAVTFFLQNYFLFL